MNHSHIQKKIADVFITCEIQSFPLDCPAIIRRQGIRIFTYQELSQRHPDLYLMGMRYSKDAFQYRNLICYNMDMPSGRIRFSLMHELGHMLLAHGENHTLQMEQEANYFASHILAPRMMIYYAGCRDTADTASRFHLTRECAAIAFDDYLSWRDRFLREGLSASDRLMYRHFYNRTVHKVVYQITSCQLCGCNLYNTDNSCCPFCHAHIHRQTAVSSSEDFLCAEAEWLTPS